jgi:hypothetical protein
MPSRAVARSARSRGVASSDTVTLRVAVPITAPGTGRCPGHEPGKNHPLAVGAQRYEAAAVVWSIAEPAS